VKSGIRVRIKVVRMLRKVNVYCKNLTLGAAKLNENRTRIGVAFCIPFSLRYRVNAGFGIRTVL
jgi:hypothetical protein